jgi:hypothetical protein
MLAKLIGCSNLESQGLGPQSDTIFLAGAVSASFEDIVRQVRHLKTCITEWRLIAGSFPT